MPPTAQLVIGPAGCGKSTYCTEMQAHLDSLKRASSVVNLDPAAEAFGYRVSLDVRELVSLEETCKVEGLGPNGGLLRCMEVLEDHLSSWLVAGLDETCGDNDETYVLFDCPGQVELYSHVPVFRRLTEALVGHGFNVCAVYMMDAQFVSEPAKFVAGTLAVLSAMVLLEVPHVTVLSKMDICTEPKRVQELIGGVGGGPDDGGVDDEGEGISYGYGGGANMALLLAELNDTSAATSTLRALNESLARLIDDYSLVSFVPLDIRNEDSFAEVLHHVDCATQYGEDKEVKDVL